MRVHFVQNGYVINTVEQDTLDNPFGYLAVASEVGAIGWAYVDGALIAPPIAPLTLANYIGAMEEHFDAVAQSRRYDNRLTCALRAGYAGPFQREGQAFAVWMDNCNAQGYSIMAEVFAGTRPQPTVDELLTLFPALMWPA